MTGMIKDGGVVMGLSTGASGGSLPCKMKGGTP